MKVIIDGRNDDSKGCYWRLDKYAYEVLQLDKINKRKFTLISDLMITVMVNSRNAFYW